MTVMMRFFKKVEPRQALLLSNGTWFKFAPSGDYGLLATEDTFLIREIGMAMAGQRGGITEIDFAEYDQLKKNPWYFPRQIVEKLSPQFVRAMRERFQGAVRVVDEKIQVGLEKAKNIAAPVTNASNYRPMSVKR